MVDEFFLKSLIQITHGEIRLIDKERDIRRIGQTKEEEDPFFTDEIFFNDVLERRPEASIDIFWEDDVYYARVRRKGIQGWILAGPVQTVVGAAPALKIAQKHKIQAASYRLPYCELKTFLEAMKLLLYNENYLTGLFHKYEGITLQHYIRKEKVRQAKELLLYSSYSCSEIAALLCFSTQSHFSSAFKREVGMTPAKYRESKIQRG